MRVSSQRPREAAENHREELAGEQVLGSVLQFAVKNDFFEAEDIPRVVRSGFSKKLLIASPSVILGRGQPTYYFHNARRLAMTK